MDGNGTTPHTTRRKKIVHDLYRARNPDELLAALEARGIDLIGLVFEFVKPHADPGIVVTGSVANGIATEVSDLDVLVLLPSLTALKQRRSRIGDSKVHYMPHESESRVEVTTIVHGIDINLQLIANAAAAACTDGDGEPALRASVDLEDHNQMRFLGRLGNCWTIRNAEIVDRWQRYYEVEKFRINRIGREFTAAAKNLEDMHASIGKGPGCAGILGVKIVSRAMQALLAFHGFSFVSGKWLRKVNEMIEDPDNSSSDLFEAGRRLAFPGLFETEAEEAGYFAEVQQYCRSVRSQMSKEDIVSIMLDGVVERFDVML